jgi:hypothetical protein
MCAEREMLPLSAATPIWPNLWNLIASRAGLAAAADAYTRVSRRPGSGGYRVCRYSLRGAPPGGASSLRRRAALPLFDDVTRTPGRRPPEWRHPSWPYLAWPSACFRLRVVRA